MSSITYLRRYPCATFELEEAIPILYQRYTKGIQKAKKRYKGENTHKKRRCSVDFCQKVCVFRKKSVILQAYYKIARL